MEPITTSAMIGGIVTYLSTQLAQNKSIKDFLADFSEGTVNWIRPLFLKEDGTPQRTLARLQADPTNTTWQELIKAELGAEPSAMWVKQ